MRIISAPRRPRWLIVARSRYPAGGERIAGGYRWGWVAALIAWRYPEAFPGEHADYAVRRATYERVGEGPR
jgi:hypothetical protein